MSKCCDSLFQIFEDKEFEFMEKDAKREEEKENLSKEIRYKNDYICLAMNSMFNWYLVI